MPEEVENGNLSSDVKISHNVQIVRNLNISLETYSNDVIIYHNEGRKANCPKSYRKSEEKLAGLQRKLSRMEEGSANHQRMKTRIARLHRKIRDQRLDFVCKEAASLASQYDVVVVEDIDLRAMAQGLKLAKGLNDNGFGMFRDRLSRKLEEKGSVLVKVSRWFPSSQTCHACGHVLEGGDRLGLSDREWTCPACGARHDRDVNAAVNIREEGKRIFLEYFREWLEEDRKAREHAEKRSAGRRKKRAA